jgi:hypothetical protein
MVNTVAQQNFLDKYKAQRENKNHVFSLGLENSTSSGIQAEILSSKSGLSSMATIDGYNELYHMDSFPDTATFMICTIYCPDLQKSVSFRTNFPATNVFVYTIDNDTNVATLVQTIALGIDIFQVFDVLYSEFDNSWYFKCRNTVAGITTIFKVNSSFTGYTSLNIASFVGYTCGWYIDQVNGTIFIADATTVKVAIISLTGFSVTATPAVTGASQPYFVYYNSALDKIYISALHKLYVMDGTSYVVTQLESVLNSYSSDLVEIDGYLIRVLYLSAYERILQKWDMINDVQFQSNIISNITTNPTGRQRFWTDSLGNFWHRDAINVVITNKNGQVLTHITQEKVEYVIGTVAGLDFRMPSGFEGHPIPTQRFNPINKGLWLGGESASLGGTQILYEPNYQGGLNGLTVTTSACSYGMALAEFNTEPIAVTHLMIFYKNGGVNLTNLLSYLKETATGACVRRYFQPKSFISAQFGSDKIIEIDFCENPLIIDVQHYFKMLIPAGEKIDFLLFYRQANRKDVLKNKLIC